MKKEKIFDNSNFRIYIWERKYDGKIKYLAYKKIFWFIWMDVLFPTLEDAMEFVETGKINKYKKKLYWENLRNGGDM
jgi:hypothetical protein